MCTNKRSDEDEEQERLFAIDWLGYEGQHTWEKEINLNKCTPMLRKYLEENNLEATKIKRAYGASTIARVNPYNWVDLETIFHYIETYRKTPKTNTKINIEKFKKVRNSDTIYIITEDDHCL